MIYILPVLAVLLSFIIIKVFNPRKTLFINLLLAFSGSSLLSLTFFELLPSVYTKANSKTIALFILAGLLLQIFLEFFSKGAEHGHMHFSLEKNKFPVILFISLSIHALVEGMPITNDNNILMGILVHKVPIALILSIFLINSELKKTFIYLFILLFAVMTPIGSYLASSSPFFSNYKTYLHALSIGVFLHIATIILFESSKGHSFNMQKLLVIILGITTAYFI